MLHFLKNLLQLILSPEHGWEEISFDGKEPDKLASEGMYPLFAIMGATSFVQGFYEPTFDVGQQLQSAMVKFVALLVAYFAGMALMEIFVGKMSTKDVSIKNTKTVALYIISLLAVIQIVENFVPVDFTVIKVLPLFLIIVVYHSMSYLSIDTSRAAHYVLATMAALILPWFLLVTFMGMIL